MFHSIFFHFSLIRNAHIIPARHIPINMNQGVLVSKSYTVKIEKNDAIEPHITLKTKVDEEKTTGKRSVVM
jgi:hypothetical protein